MPRNCVSSSSLPLVHLAALLESMGKTVYKAKPKDLRKQTLANQKKASHHKTISLVTWFCGSSSQKIADEGVMETVEIKGTYHVTRLAATYTAHHPAAHEVLPHKKT